MNVILLLASFLVVIGECGTLGSAKKSKSVKFTLEKRSSGVVERDLSNFQQQINGATYLNMGSCSSNTCWGPTYSSYCGGICSKNSTLFQQVATQIQNCYVQGICGNTPLSNQLTNINISIASGSYPGSCYLTGQVVTMALTKQSSTTQTPGDSYTPFYVKENLVYTFTGLSLHCQPAAQGSSCFTCCGNDLLTSLVCLVQQIVGSLGTNLNLLACNCNCSGRKRDVEGAIVSKRQATSAIDSALTVAQTESFVIDYILQYNSQHVYLSGNAVSTLVSFTSAIPSQYQAVITAGIASVFNDYNTFYTLQHNFYNTHYNLFFNFFKTTCNSCN